MPKRSITFHDLMAVLLNGVVIDLPKYDETTGDYRYLVKGKSIDEEEAVAVTVIISHREVLIITVY